MCQCFQLFHSRILALTGCHLCLSLMVIFMLIKSYTLLKHSACEEAQGVISQDSSWIMGLLKGCRAITELGKSSCSFHEVEVIMEDSHSSYIRLTLS